MNLKEIFFFMEKWYLFNQFLADVAFIYPLKISKNRKVIQFLNPKYG